MVEPICSKCGFGRFGIGVHIKYNDSSNKLDCLCKRCGYVWSENTEDHKKSLFALIKEKFNDK